MVRTPARYWCAMAHLGSQPGWAGSWLVRVVIWTFWMIAGCERAEAVEIRRRKGLRINIVV
jgi:hypothetical protein